MILVTGASGLIGRALVKRLLAAGNPVVAQTRSLSGFESVFVSQASLPRERLRVRKFDFGSEDEAAYDALVKDCDTIIHCAGVVHDPAASAEAYAIYNVRATRLLAEAAVRAGVITFVFFSSSAVYGKSFVFVDETMPFDVESPYALSKSNCEAALKRLHHIRRKIIFRPSLVFGEGDRGNMASLMKQVRSGLYFNIKGNLAQKSVIYSEDVALATEMSLLNVLDGNYTFNLANAQPVGVNELGDKIAEVWGKPAPPLVPEKLVRTAARMSEKLLKERTPLSLDRVDKLMTTTTLDTHAITEATGFHPRVSLETALQREAEWLKIKSARPT